jgi:demethylmenaquinone methyltransferase / 2-methoxy-6-polyprenyl-1,4-benzoquinol methylase
MDKQEKIISMFNEISGTYDKLNRILSLGIDRRWRQIACRKSFEHYKKPMTQIVDVACGTGDMLRFWEEEAAKYGETIENFAGVDPSSGMLEVAKKKIAFAEFFEGKATELPFEDGSVDIVSITYGIRNVVEREAAWDEFYRILKPGGLVVILEFSKPERQMIMANLMKWWLGKMIPFVGKIVSGHSEAYSYLPDSIDEFATTKELVNELKRHQFKEEFVKGYSFEVSTLFMMRK